MCAETLSVRPTKFPTLGNAGYVVARAVPNTSGRAPVPLGKPCMFDESEPTELHRLAIHGGRWHGLHLAIMALVLVAARHRAAARTLSNNRSAQARLPGSRVTTQNQSAICFRNRAARALHVLPQFGSPSGHGAHPE
eukprot:5002418-Prymnesium_polylepis.1